jgi:two-component system OmpR family response regulator
MQEAGFVVDNAEDGEDALYLALSASYDAAIMDVMLPKLDGLSMIARMPQRKILTPVMPCWRELKIDQGNERCAG